MSSTRIRIPPEVRGRVFEAARQAVRDGNYVTASTGEKTAFMDQLTSMASVGGVLRNYIDETKLRSWIKDNLLRALSREQFRQPTSADHLLWCQNKFGIDDLISISLRGVPNVLAFKSRTLPFYVVIGESSYKSWESALRAALLQIGRIPCFSASDAETHLVLSLSVGSTALTNSDKDLMNTALSFANASVRFV